MRRLSAIVSLVLAFFVLPSVATAQFKANNIELVTAAGEPTGATVVSQTGASVTFRNDFAVDLVLRICDPTTGEVLAEETISANSTETHNHGRGVGTYDLKVKVAGQPDSSYQKVGTLSVQKV